MKSIGLIIIFGIILGLILDKTKATKSISHAILKLTGKKNAGMAIHSTGFITGIPIFCDSGFIVLQGINKSLIRSTGKPMVYLVSTGLGLFIPFLIAAFLKTAQGSSTVAIMITASIISPMLVSLNLNSDRGTVLATLAMGAGSMMISHANNAFFW
jgi:GntP family gluconate:H+ symporter